MVGTDTVQIGIGKSARRAYGFDDITIVPSRRTREEGLTPVPSTRWGPAPSGAGPHYVCARRPVLAAASSIRSIALSGKNRSVM